MIAEATSLSPAELVDAFVAQALPPEASARKLKTAPSLQAFPAGKALLGLGKRQRAAAVALVLLRLKEAVRASSGTYTFHNRRTLLQGLAQRLTAGLPGALAEEEVVALAEAASQLTRYLIWDAPVKNLLSIFESHVKAHGLSPALHAALSQIELTPLGAADKTSELAERFRLLLRGEVRVDPRELPVEILPGDAWAEALLAGLAELPPARREAWQSLLEHCRSATTASPSAGWLAAAARRVEAVGADDFVRLATEFLAALGRPGSRPVASPEGLLEATLLDPRQTDLLRGLLQAAGAFGDERLAPVLGDAVLACLEKVPYHGPRNLKVARAGLEALRLLSGGSAAAQLGRLRQKVHAEAMLAPLAEALAEVSGRLGVTPAELEEISVPRFGMEEVGLYRQSLGDFIAELRPDETGGVGLAWIAPGGKPQASIPAAVKAAHAEELARLRRLQKEMEGILTGERARLEQLYLTARAWDLAIWRERYLDHPLIGVLARRLIWRFDDGAAARLAIAPDGVLLDGESRPVGGLADATRVSLWHPLASAAPEVHAWRLWLEEHGVRQPWKQAHREIYRLTDAELATASYSNRFAGHILKQHALAAVAVRRGWKADLQGAWDGAEPPRRRLPERDLEVEFHLEPADVEAETSATGVYLYLTSDRVRFFDGDGAPRPLAEVPALLFSELMRDVDLFVSVASIGNDPNWADRGADGRTGPYWQSYAWGELGATARTRRELLERLLPRLAIAPRCTLAERFLVVRGDLRTYKIHLGSGNILMEPDDQYLCIVAGRAGAAPFLPFAGDPTFATILSKAFLLAEDTRIDDPTITRQIRPGGA